MGAMEPYDNSLVEPIEMRMIRPSQFPTRSPDLKNSPELESLKTSIMEHGLLQPIIVRPLAHGFEIVAGHRRFAACKSLRWRFIPCKIMEFADKQAYEIQLTENLQRKTIDPVEEALSYQRYVIDFGWGGISELGRRIGKSEEYVSHRMQLLKLPEEVREKVTSRILGVSQALELADARLGAQAQEMMAQEIIDNKMTVKQIRRVKSELKQAEAFDYSGLGPVVPDGQKKGEEGGPGRHGDDGAADAGSAREAAIIKRSILALRIALSRLDALVEDASKGDGGPRGNVELVQFLMETRRQAHAMIDDAIRYKRRQCSGGRRR